MSLFKTFRGNKSNLPQAINDGAIYALQDVEELYIDISENKRIKISDIVEIENKEALPLAPLENKFYYVKDIGSLYKYNGTEYLEIFQSPLYIDFTLKNLTDKFGKAHPFTTTFSFEKAVEEYKKGRRIIANLLSPREEENSLILMNHVDLSYDEKSNFFASSHFLVEGFSQGNNSRSGVFFWGELSSGKKPVGRLQLDTDYDVAISAKADKPKRVNVTLTASGWNSSTKTQAVTVDGVLADESAQIIQPMPTMESQSAYNTAGILAIKQAENSITFTALTIPTADLSVYIVITEVTA